VKSNVLVRVQAVVFFVTVLDQLNKNSVQSMLYNVALYHKPEFNKVSHFCYNSFFERFQVEKPRGIA
jgi:hypothetical protein